MTHYIKFNGSEALDNFKKVAVPYITATYPESIEFNGSRIITIFDVEEQNATKNDIIDLLNSFNIDENSYKFVTERDAIYSNAGCNIMD